MYTLILMGAHNFICCKYGLTANSGYQLIRKSSNYEDDPFKNGHYPISLARQLSQGRSQDVFHLKSHTLIDAMQLIERVYCLNVHLKCLDVPGSTY